MQKIPNSIFKAMQEISSYIREGEFDHWHETDFHPDHIAAQALKIETPFFIP